jgi:hypothetical protein
MSWTVAPERAGAIEMRREMAPRAARPRSASGHEAKGKDRPKADAGKDRLRGRFGKLGLRA